MKTLSTSESLLLETIKDDSYSDSEKIEIVK